MDELNNKVQIISSDDILVKYNPTTDKVYLEIDRNKVNLITNSEKNKLQNIDENANNLFHNMITTTDGNEKINIDGEDIFLPIGSKKAIHTYDEIKEAIGDDNDFIDTEGKEIIDSLKGTDLSSIKFFLSPVLTTDNLPNNNINSGSICFVKNQKDIYFLNENNGWESLTNRLRQNISLEGLEEDIDIILTDSNVINNIINRITINERNISLTSTEIEENKTILESQIKQNARMISSTVSEFKYDFEDFFKVDLYGKNDPESSTASSNNNKIFLNQSTGSYFKSNGTSWDILNTPNPTLFGTTSPESEGFTYPAEDYNNVVYLRTGSNINYYKSNGETWNLLENITYKIPIPTLFGCGVSKDFYDINSITDNDNEYYSNHYRGYVNTTNGKLTMAFYNQYKNKWEWIFIKTLKLLPETLKSTIEQTARSIRTEVSDEVRGLNSTITQTASDIRALITSNDGRISLLEDTVDGLTSTSLNNDEEISSSIRQTASSIASTVGEFKYNYEEDGFFKVDFYSENDPDTDLAINNENKIYLKQTSDNNCKYYKSNGNIWEELNIKIPSINSQYPPTENNINNGNFTIPAGDYLNKYILINGGALYKSNGTSWEFISDKSYRYPIPTLFGIAVPRTHFNPSETKFHYKGYVNTVTGKYYICYYDITDDTWKWFYVKLLTLSTDNLTSKINQTKDEITLEINDLKGNKSEIDQKIDSINLSVIQNKYNFNYDENDITTRFINVSYYSKDLEKMNQEELNAIQYVSGEIKLDQDNYKFYIYKNSNWIEFDPNNLSDINHPYYKSGGSNLNNETVSKKFYPIPTLFGKYYPTNSNNPYKNIKEDYYNRTYVRTISNRVFICKFDTDSNKWKWVDTGRNIKFTNDIFRSSIKLNSDSITSEVNRATNAENSLSSQIKQTEKNIALSVVEGKYDYDCNYEGSNTLPLFLSEYEAPSLFGNFGTVLANELSLLTSTYTPSENYKKVCLNYDNGDHFACIKDTSNNNIYRWVRITTGLALNNFLTDNEKPQFPKPTLFGPGAANIYYPNPNEEDNEYLHYRTYINTNTNVLVACLKDSDDKFKWTLINHIKFLSDALKSEIQLTKDSIQSSVNNAMSGYSSRITQNENKINLIVDNAFTGSGSSLSLSTEKIKMAWNGISNYIEFTNGYITIKSEQNKKLIKLSCNGLESYNSSEKLLSKLNGSGFNIYSTINSNSPIMKLNENGNNFYEVDSDSSYYIGSIGTSNMKQSTRDIELILGRSSGKGLCSSYDELKSVRGLSLKLNSSYGKYITMSYNNKEYFEFYPVSVVKSVDNNDYSKKFVRRAGFTFYDDLTVYGQLYVAKDKIYSVNFSGGNGNNAGFQNGVGEFSIGGCSENDIHPGVRLCSIDVNYMKDDNGYWIYDNQGQRIYGTTNLCQLDIYNNKIECSKKLIVNGTITGSSFINSSDIRLKTNINDSNIEGLKTLSKIKLKSFNWILDNSYENVGIIAQQLESVDPELVNIGENSILGINSSKIIFYIIKAIQELMKKLNINFDDENIEEHLNDFTYEEKIEFLKSIKYLQEE